MPFHKTIVIRNGYISRFLCKPRLYHGDSSTASSSHANSYSFGFLMLLGTFVTQIWVPDSRDAHGNSMSLEDLAKGRAYMKTLRKTGQWWNRWHTADVDHTADTEMDDAG